MRVMPDGGRCFSHDFDGVMDMPKIKTRSSVKKRFKITGTGKLRRHKAGSSHNLSKKSGKGSRKIREETAVSSTNEKQILRLFGR